MAQQLDDDDEWGARWPSGLERSTGDRVVQGSNWLFIYMYVKEPRLKSLTYRTLGFSEYGLTNAISITPDCNPNVKCNAKTSVIS